MKANDTISAVACLAKRAYSEFSDVLDYVWKSPRLIDHEYKLETKKLEAYFPLTGDPEQDSSALKYRQMRWALEGNKLESTFPYLIAVGNLFASVSLFDTYCLMLCKSIDSKASKSLINCKGSGISKLFNFLIANGVELKDVSLYQQVYATLKIRNTLFHASGLLMWSRETQQLRNIVGSAAYLPPDIRENYRRLNQSFDGVRITSGPLCERLRITNEYAYIATSFLRDYFCNVCKRVDAIYPEKNSSPREMSSPSPIRPVQS